MSHDASLAVYQDGEIQYASHGERYSRVKNDRDLHPDQIAEALRYGEPDQVLFYENTTLKKFRQLLAGQFDLLRKQSPTEYMQGLGITAPVKLVSHHESHAAYTYYSSPFVDADILVIDSIGEFDTMSVWQGVGDKITKTWSQRYPHSVGLWYSAMTQRLGLKPQEHEYILMGMAALGDPDRFYNMIMNDFVACMPTAQNPSVRFKINLHRGCQTWRPDINQVTDYVDVAATVQRIYEEMFVGVLRWMKNKTGRNNVAIAGGCALNCVANTLAFSVYDHVWIPPNPGDAGSSVGAIYADARTKQPLLSPYLGTRIPGAYPVDQIIDDLVNTGLSAVANGRAEFGPRALGHRSILADPRILDIKDRVNTIKQREEFRPFAPMILTEHVDTYFDVPNYQFDAPYMQYAIPYKRPCDTPGIVHVDGTSRVQTVSRTDDPDVRRLLDAWYARTGCPMLLNTSLNIKGEPLVNTVDDAQRWSARHGLTVRT
jgi:carbamoyltransferase